MPHIYTAQKTLASKIDICDASAMRTAAKIDINQPGIVSALLACGCSVQTLAAVGCGVPDLLVYSPSLQATLLLEVKNPEEHSAEVRRQPRRALTPAQRKFHGAWRGPIAIVWDVAEALRACGIQALPGTAAVEAPFAYPGERR